MLGNSHESLESRMLHCSGVTSLTRWFWATKVCLRASKISKICLFGCLTGQANFENYSYSAILVNVIQHEHMFSFRDMFLLPAYSSRSHATTCLMSHHRVNSKCNGVKRIALKMVNLCPT